jgi:chromosome segregation ATPase
VNNRDESQKRQQLPKDDFYTPTDIDALRMENELLTFEVRFLKARLADCERSRTHLEKRRARLVQLEQQLDERKGQLEESRAQLEESKAQLEELQESNKSRAQLEEQLQEAERSIARLESAEKDLVLLLRRLATSPLSLAFRRKQAFRDLEQRYLGTDA